MKYIILLTALITNMPPGYAHTSSSQDSSGPSDSVPLISATFSHTGDFASNLSGGLRKGATYLGLANVILQYNIEKAGLWRNGQLFLNVAWSYGGEPSASLTGDFHGLSNIEAGNHLFVQEVGLYQKTGKMEWRAGLLDLNAIFACNETGAGFLNSSFGIPSLITDNITAPVYPLTSLGLHAQMEISEKISAGFAIHDGSPLDFEKNPNNLRWQPGAKHGLFILAEGRLILRKEHPEFRAKTGMYFHSGNIYADREIEDKILPASNYGGYLIAESTLKTWEKTGVLNGFLQIAFSPWHKNHHNGYLGGGITFKANPESRLTKETGIAFACAAFDRFRGKCETTFEFYLKLDITPGFFIQPDFQYILTPGGADPVANHAFAFLFRTGFQL